MVYSFISNQSHENINISSCEQLYHALPEDWWNELYLFINKLKVKEKYLYLSLL